MAGPRIGREHIIEALAERPMTTRDLAALLDRGTLDGTRRVLDALATHRLVVKPKGKVAPWKIGDGSGLALAGAAGGVWVNAMVVDHHGVPVRGTPVAKRRTGQLRNAAHVARDLGAVMAEAVDSLPAKRRRYLAGVGVALPFGLMPDGSVASVVGRQKGVDVPHALRKALVKTCKDLPMWKRTQWVFTSDVAGEAMAEFRHGRLDQPAGREGPVGVTPLMVVKAHREIRLSLLVDGKVADQGGVDLGHVRASLDGMDDDQQFKISPDSRAAMIQRFNSTTDELCDVCNLGTQCLQMVVSPDTIYETLWPGKNYEEAFGAAITTPAGKARSDPRAFDWIFGKALEDEDGEAAAMFHAAGLLLGRSLEPIVTLHNPPVLIVTGFLARTEHFRRGISDALFRHVDSKPPLSVITASGIRGKVSDPASADAHAVQHLDYQYWPTSGAARMVLDEVVLPWAKEKAANAS